MLVKRVVVGPLGTNAYVVAREAGAAAAVIDPGGDAQMIIDEALADELAIQYVICTHGHADHIAAAGDVLEATGAKLVIHELDAPMLADPVGNISAFMGASVRAPSADVLVADGDSVKMDGLSLDVLHTPGHTPGGISVLVEDVLFSGDLLFAGSVGRTDLPGGSARQLAESLKAKIAPLQDDVRVYPGHGEPTSVGREKMVNPFLRGET